MNGNPLLQQNYLKKTIFLYYESQLYLIYDSSTRYAFVHVYSVEIIACSATARGVVFDVRRFPCNTDCKVPIASSRAHTVITNSQCRERLSLYPLLQLSSLKPKSYVLGASIQASTCKVFQFLASTVVVCEAYFHPRWFKCQHWNTYDIMSREYLLFSSKMLEYTFY